MKRYTLITTAALFAVIGCLIWAGSSSAATPCQVRACHANVGMSSPQVEHWQSSQTFGPHYHLELVLSVDGKEAANPNIEEACTGEWSGHGVSFRVEVCGHGRVPIRITYVSLKGHHHVTADFRSFQAH